MRPMGTSVGADRKDVRITGSAMVVNANSVVDLETGVLCQFNVRHDAYADEYKIGAYRSTVTEINARNGIAARKTGQPGRQH